MPKPFLSLIIPVRNEEATILSTLLSIDYTLSLSEFSYEVIVVDDASHDRTAYIAQNYEKVLGELKCIERKTRGGRGAAIKEGMAAAHGNIRMVLFSSCIGFLNMREEMLSAFKNGAQVVTGSRNKSVEPLPFARAIKRSMRRAGNWLICGNLLREVSDVRFGAMAMTEDAAKWLFSFSELSDGSGIFFELFVLSMANGYRIHEIEYTNDDACGYGRGMGNWLRVLFSAWGIRARAKKRHPKREERKHEEALERELLQ